MSKIFRIYKNGATTYQDWNESPVFPYNSTARDTIDDPTGASAAHEITSIPSPFARIDLVKTAFKEVCKPTGKSGMPNLDGNSIFHKMVSDTLDVAEIFFNIDKYQGKVEIIKWDPSMMLDQLAQSPIPGHQYLADALNKYLVSDAATYNFGQLQNIYLLNYINGPEQLNIIGATSPATLFFSNANDLWYVNDIYFAEDRPFDDEYQPLYKRDAAFIIYLFTLRKSIPGFANLFPEVNQYLDLTYNKIQDPNLKNDLRAVQPNDFQDAEEITVSDGQANNIVEVLGYSLYKKSSRASIDRSEFLIHTSKDTPLKPLVLPVEAGNVYSDFIYTTGKWGKTNAAPYFDKQDDLEKRVLPFDGGQYPYLTINDFLEDTIIRVPHTLNKESYFDGGLKLDKQELAYLLPLRPRFFEYFSIEELKSKMPNGKPMFEMESRSGGAVKAVLRIPVVGNGRTTYIEYSRLYHADNSADIARNSGGMRELNFTGLIMPQVRFISDEEALYNISCIQYFQTNYKYQFFKETPGGVIQVIPDKTACRNEDGQEAFKAENYLIEKTNFDIVQVSDRDGAMGMLIPLFRQQRNREQFEFAIDLGTSNTHIEFRKAGERESKPLTITEKDRQACTMFVATRDEAGYELDLTGEKVLVEQDFIPGEVGKSDFHFPTRTVLAYARTTDWTNVVDPFMLVNLPFTYDKRTNLDYNKFKYNIKWGKGEENVMDSYIRSIMLIIRNKVLLNDGDIHKTQITWFYPISMDRGRRAKLTQLWNNAYETYFGSEGSTKMMTESAAPIEYFFKKYSTATSLVNVDIGGGTTDIAFATDRNVNYVTSFRFASNTLFENPYSEIDDNNGIIDHYKYNIFHILEDKNLYELINVFNSESNQRPSNMASFLFSLKENARVLEKDVNPRSVDFNYILQEDEHFKIVFIIFYTSIIYHIAQMVKDMGLEEPRHISFSGNGSRVVNVITTDSHLLADYTKVIFEKVLGRPYGKELDILGLEKNSNPKESTCKGGIISTENDITPDKVMVFKSNGAGMVSESDTYGSITPEYKERVLRAVEDFFKFMFDINADFNLVKNFGVERDTIEIAKATARKDLATFLDKGIASRLEESEPDEKIEETFFFYPIKGVLNALSAEIFKTL